MRPPKEELTRQSASRLLGSRLRRFVYERVYKDDPHLEDLLGYQDRVEEEAAREWSGILALWRDQQQDPSQRALLESIIQRALNKAVELFKDSEEDPQRAEDAIRDYVGAFHPTSLLPGEVS